MDGNKPSVRTVNSFYENGAFYIITYALSNKMKQIKENATVAVFCQVLFPIFTVKIPCFCQGNFPIISGDICYASLRIRACSIR